MTLFVFARPRNVTITQLMAVNLPFFASNLSELLKAHFLVRPFSQWVGLPLPVIGEFLKVRVTWVSP